MINRRHLIAAASALAAPLALSARAQTAAAGTTRIVVGFAPGGSTDTLARVLATRLQKDGGSWLVENKPGAGGRLAVMEVRGAAPDGRTVLLTPDPMMVIYPHAYRRLAYDPQADFRPVAPVATVPIGLAVGPMVPASVKTMADFAQWCKANPQQAAYGSAGAGTTLHFIGVMYARAAALPAYTHVPYKGGLPAAQDVMAGQIASSINVMGELVPLAQAGRLRVLGVSSPQRSRFLPDVPTFRESGFRELEAQNWFGTFVPARTPDAVVRQLEAAIAEATRSAEVQEGLGKLGYDVLGLPPERFAALVKADFERWGPIVRASGYTAED